MRIERVQILDEYCHEGDTTYQSSFDFYLQWLFKYFNEITIGENIESTYSTWKSEQKN